MDEAAQKVLIFLSSARTKTVGSEKDSQYGVYFDNSVTPGRIILFKGPSYSSRDPSFDEVYSFPQDVSFESISLAGGSEVVFEKITGETQNPGYVTVKLLHDQEKMRTLYVKGSGQIDLVDSGAPSDEARVKDSRHVHFDYSREIELTETMLLEFEGDNGTTTEEVLIESNMKGGQFYWDEEVDVEGDVQKLTIRTQRFNSPDTEFCIHRDRRFNDKTLAITLSGDSSGAIIYYSADGLNTSSPSIYTNQPVWQ